MNDGRDQTGLTRLMLNEGAGVAVVVRARAQRFEIRIPLRYRGNGDTHWRKGMTRNISCSGVLFQGEFWAGPSTSLEISLVLPKESTGASAAQVVCQATVTRSERCASNGGGAIIAIRISRYRFVRP
jgi:hypothetical protein